GVEFVSVGVDPEAMNELVDNLGLARMTPEIVFHGPRTDDPVLATIARSIADEMEGEPLGRDEMLDALGRQLMLHLLRQHLTVRRSPRVELSRAGPVDRRIR